MAPESMQHGNVVSAACRICGAAEVKARAVFHETTFGTGEQFDYQQCASCRCFEIVDCPKEMAEYYPANYYAYSEAPADKPGIKARLRNLLSNDGPGWLFAGRAWWEQGDRKSVREAGLSRSDRILDIGCGTGGLIASLADIGFRRLLGADPYITNDMIHRNGVRVLKREIGEIEGEFDCVMMHHSLEHIWDQHAVAGHLARLMAPGGKCIIRIPTIDCWAWEEYGADWVALDPPRHFYLHSRDSIRRLLEPAGLKVVAITDDSHAFQILASEKVRSGQPVMNPQTGQPDYANFLPDEIIASAPRRSLELNKAGRGDSIAVHVRKAS